MNLDRHRTRRCRLGVLVCLAAVFSLAGCSTFERDWRDARLTPRLQDDLAGRWEGTWRSEATGHNDHTWAVIDGQ